MFLIGSKGRPLSWLALVLCLAFNRTGTIFGAAKNPPIAKNNIEALLNTATVQEGDRFNVLGYHQPRDAGGGIFSYDKDSRETGDGGTIFVPRFLPGRFKRSLSPNQEPYAEWFGARGDGIRDDKDAINATLSKFHKVKLRGRVYGVRGTPFPNNPNATHKSIGIGPEYKIEGAGKNRTVVRLLNRSNPMGPNGNNYFIMIANRNFHESAENVIIRDLTLDGNFDGQDTKTTIQAIQIRGGNPLVERVKFVGFAAGYNPENELSQECFPVSQGLVFKDEKSSRKGGTFRDLEFTKMGHNGSVATARPGEITLIDLDGAHNFYDASWILRTGRDPDYDARNGGENTNNWWPSYGGLIENVYVHDIPYDPKSQKSFLHAFMVANNIGAVVRNNRVENFDGAGVFMMSWWAKNLTFRNNKFHNVRFGLNLSLMSTGDGSKKAAQHPHFENIVFEENEIRLSASAQHKTPNIGMFLYGAEIDNTKRMSRITLRRNTVEGRKYRNEHGTFYPTGFAQQIQTANQEWIRVTDNIFELPDYSPANVVFPQEPYSHAMMYYPLHHWTSDFRTGNFYSKNNRNRAGKLLKPILADWTFSNPPQYGETSDAPVRDKRFWRLCR